LGIRNEKLYGFARKQHGAETGLYVMSSVS